MCGLLPYHPHPQQGDSFKSWVLDLASGNGNSVRELFQGLGLHRCWHLGIVHPNEQVIRTLSEVTGTPEQEVINTFPSSFRAIYKDVSRHHFYYGRRRAWHLHTGPSGHVIGQYCKYCLLEGRYQVRWYFALFACCPIHHCWLEDGCTCGAPAADLSQLYNVAAAEMVKFRKQLLKCSKCGRSLVGDRTKAAAVQSETEGICQLHYSLAHDENCRPYFTVLHRLLRLLSSTSSYSDRLRAHLLGNNFQLGWRLDAGSHSFEDMDARTRMALLREAVRLIQHWPDLFVETLRAVEVPSRSITLFTERTPGWYSKAVTLVSDNNERRKREVRNELLIRAREQGWIGLFEELQLEHGTQMAA